MLTKRRILALIAVGALLVGLMVAAIMPASAETPTPTPTAPSTTTKVPDNTVMKSYLEALAKNLGVTVDQLSAAAKKTAIEQVNKAVADGKITQAQADALIAKINQAASDGIMSLCPMQMGRGGKMGPMADDRGRGMSDRMGDMMRGFKVDAMTTSPMEAIAKVLGTTEEDLAAQIRSGKSLSDIAAAKGITIDSLKASAIAAVKAQVDQAVKDGKITQAQADKVMQSVEQMISKMFEAKASAPTTKPQMGTGMLKGFRS